MPIDFPSSPTTGEVYTYEGRSWVYSGTAWDSPRSLSEVGAVRTYANAAARSAAIPSPTEGIYTHLNDVDRLEFWNGSAWQSPFGITLLATSTFTDSSLVAIDNVFTSEFENYKMVYDLSTPSAAEIRLRFRVGGVPTNTSNYKQGRLEIGAADSSAFASTDSSTATYFRLGATSSASGLQAGDVTIYSPQLTKRTRVTANTTGLIFHTGGYEMDVTTAFDGLAFTAQSGALMTGTIRVYGWRNS